MDEKLQLSKALTQGRNWMKTTSTSVSRPSAKIERVPLRAFRQHISEKLDSVISGHARLVITKNNDDCAGVIPIEMMRAIDQIAEEIDLNRVMKRARDRENILNLFFDYFVRAVKGEGAELSNGQWSELKDYYLDRILLEKYPPEYQRDLASAKHLWVIGTNLRRIVPVRFKELRQVLEGGGTVRAMFVDPTKDDAIRYSAMQEHGNFSGDEMRAYQRKLINGGRNELMKLAKETKSGDITIYKIDYPLSFGLDVIDGNTDKGIIYVRYYPFGDDGQPILRLTRENEMWYEYYLFQLERLNTTAEVWKD
jgi:prevent-host-death family protein